MKQTLDFKFNNPSDIEKNDDVNKEKPELNIVVDNESEKKLSTGKESKSQEDKRIESLIQSGYFEDSQEAMDFLEEISESFDIANQNQIATDEFLLNFQEIISEAENQTREVEMGLKESNLDSEAVVDKKQVFKDSIKGILDNFEEFESQGKESEDSVPGLIKKAKKFARFIKKNQRALKIFTIASAAFRLMEGSAEGSEFDEMTSEMIDFAGIAPDDFEGEVLESGIEAGSFSDLVSESPSENFESLVKDIKAAKNEEGAIVQLQESDSSNNNEPAYDTSGMTPEMIDYAGVDEVREGMSDELINQRVQEIMKNVENGLEQSFTIKAFDFLIIDQVIEKNKDKSVNELNDHAEFLLSVVPTENIQDFDDTNSVNVYGTGSTPEDAFLSAMKEAANYKGINVQSSSESNVSSETGSSDSFYDRFAKRTEIGCDEIITVESVEDVIKKSYNGQDYYEVIINFH